MKKLALLACLALAGCDSATGFNKGDASSGIVQLDRSDKCVVWVHVQSQSQTSDVGLHARIISPECSK
jgi:hypothetical protein